MSKHRDLLHDFCLESYCIHSRPTTCRIKSVVWLYTKQHSYLEKFLDFKNNQTESDINWWFSRTVNRTSVYCYPYLGIHNKCTKSTGTCFEVKTNRCNYHPRKFSFFDFFPTHYASNDIGIANSTLLWKSCTKLKHILELCRYFRSHHLVWVTFVSAKVITVKMYWNME